MFDKTIVRPTVHQHTTVHEHRAPTEESIKLLGEYQERALLWARDAVILKLQPINASIGNFYIDLPNDQAKLCALINSKKVMVSWDNRLRTQKDKYAAHEEICQIIATQLMINLFDKRAIG